MRRGFSLVELVSVVVVVASVTAVLGPTIGHMRGQMRGVSSEGNLAAIGQAGAMYGLDHEDRIFSYNWRAGEPYINLANGKMLTSNSDQAAAARQLQNILHRATDRINGPFNIRNPGSALVHRRYSHLVLADYMGNVGESLWADPADSRLLTWQAFPTAYQLLPYGDGLPDSFGYEQSFSLTSLERVQLWPFGSSYQLVPHSWMSDFDDSYVPLSFTPHAYSTNGQPYLGDRMLSEVRFPSAKVLMYEEFDRERVGEPYFAYNYATVGKLMFDGSINTMRSDASQSSVSPADYQFGGKFVWRQIYLPFDQFPVPIGGLGDQTELDMRYQWTLGGLSGVDYPQVLMRPGR